MRFFSFAMTVAAFLLVSCSITGGKDVQHEDSEYSYDLDYNGCKTGKQTFGSKASYCRGLQNEELNNGCAANLRQDLFKKGCDGEPVTNGSAG